MVTTSKMSSGLSKNPYGLPSVTLSKPPAPIANENKEAPAPVARRRGVPAAVVSED
jgi:hypothetical protein